MTFYDVMQDVARELEGIGEDERRFASVYAGGKGARLGTFLLIHGNGLDVVSDRHWPKDKPESEALLAALAKPAAEYAGSLLS